MRIEVDGVRLYFDVEGAGLVGEGPRMVARPTVVLVHGGPGADHSVFKPWLSPLADTAQLVYLDLRGSGRSDRGEPHEWEWDRWASDIVALCDALEIDAPVLLGSSAGTWVALQAALDHPSRVRGLVLDSAMPATHEHALEVFARTGGPEAVEAARRFYAAEPGEEVTREFVDRCIPLYTRRMPDALRPDLLARIERNPDVEWRLRTGRLAAFDPWDRLHEVTCPTLILAGEDDPVTPAVEAARLAEALTNARARLVRYDDCGHGVFREVPGAALAATREFLATL
jgi:pimeloyl-ACP methyl ester carboxylesterase